MVKSRRPIHANKILETIEAERIRKIHEKKLRLIMSRKKGAQIDNAPPKAMKMKHVRLNLKKRKMQKDRLEYVESRNRRTMEKLMTIMDRPNPYEFEVPSQVGKSMNINSRRKHLMKINEENKHILRRLQAVEPVLSHRRLEDEYQEMEKQMKRLRQHVPTIDVYVGNKKSNQKRSPKNVINVNENDGENALPKPTIPRGKKKLKGRGNRPKVGGRIIHDSVLNNNRKNPSLNGNKKLEPSTTTNTTTSITTTTAKTTKIGKKVVVGLSQKMTLKKIFNMISKNKPEVEKKVIIREIMMNSSIQEELHKEEDLKVLLKPRTYKHALIEMDTDKDGSISFNELVTFINKLHENDYKQTNSLELVFKEINQSEEDMSDIAKKIFIKAVMRNTTVQALLHSDPALTVLLKPRRYAKALMEIDTDNDGSVSLTELKQFANHLHQTALIEAIKETEETVEKKKKDTEVKVMAQKVELRMAKKVSSNDGTMTKYILCIAYVDPLEKKKETSDTYAIHVEGYDVKTGRHYHCDGLVSSIEFNKKNGSQIAIQNLLRSKLHFEKQISTIDSSNLSIGDTDWVMVL